MKQDQEHAEIYLKLTPKRKEFDDIVRELTRWHFGNPALSGWDWDFCNLYACSPDEMKKVLYKSLPDENIGKIIWADKKIKDKSILEISKIPKVDKIKIKDYGIIKKADIKFIDGLNIIMEGTSGKTTVIDYLKEKFGTDTLSYGERTMFEIEKAIGNETILIDYALNSLDHKNTNKILESLSKSGKQIIMTAHYSDEILENVDKFKCNIIDSRKEFDLKK